MKFKIDSELNKGVRRFDYVITDNHEYRKLEELFSDDPDAVYVVKMFYTNKKSKFGDNEVVVTDDYIINLPKHLTESVKKIIKDPKYLELIEKSRFAFSIYEYDYDDSKKAYSVNWGTL